MPLAGGVGLGVGDGLGAGAGGDGLGEGVGGDGDGRGAGGVGDGAPGDLGAGVGAAPEPPTVSVSPPQLTSNGPAATENKRRRLVASTASEC